MRVVDSSAVTALMPGWRLAARMQALRGSAIDDIDAVAANYDSTINFGGGTPHPDDLPRREIATLVAEILAESPATLGYAPTLGDPELRAAILKVKSGEAGVNADRLLITTGAMQALDLTFKLFLDPGDVVLVESPTFADVLATLSGYQATVIGVPVDDDGMRVETIRALVEKLGRSPKLIYTIPNFQNPTGVTMSVERRSSLLRIAAELEATIIEDDPYSLLRFSGEVPPTLSAFDRTSHSVISIGSFSKTVAPGLRVGWMFAPEELLPQLAAAKQGMDTCTSGLSQRVIARFVSSGMLRTQITSWTERYRSRQTVMLDALAHEFGDVPGTSWTTPAGGYFIWMALPRGVSTTDLLQDALEAGTSFIPGSVFAATGEFPNALRLCYAAVAEAVIPDGIRRLKAGYTQYVGRRN